MPSRDSTYSSSGRTHGRFGSKPLGAVLGMASSNPSSGQQDDSVSLDTLPQPYSARRRRRRLSSSRIIFAHPSRAPLAKPFLDVAIRLPHNYWLLEFSNELQSDAPQTPRTSTFSAWSPLSFANAKVSTSQRSPVPHPSLKPRAPQAYRVPESLFDDDDDDDHLGHKKVIRSPAGIDIRFPLVFPSRRRRSNPLESIAPHDITLLAQASTVDSPDDDGEVPSWPSSRSTRPVKPSFDSPFPPPYISTPAKDIHLELGAEPIPLHPRRPSSLASASTRPRRTSIASSTFTFTSDDCYAVQLASSPDTFILRDSPLPTATTIVLDDPFSTSFAPTTAA